MKYKPNGEIDVHTRPSLIECGLEVGKCLVFNFKSDNEYNISIYSILQNRVIKKVQGGEAFIDLTSSESPATKTLTYLKDASIRKPKII